MTEKTVSVLPCGHFKRRKELSYGNGDRGSGGILDHAGVGGDDLLLTGLPDAGNDLSAAGHAESGLNLIAVVKQCAA